MLWKKSAGWGCIQEWGWGVTCASPTENSWRCSAKRTAWSCARRAAGPPSIRPTMWCPWRMSHGIIRWEMEASPRPQSSFSPAPHLAISRSRTWDGAPETRWELIPLTSHTTRSWVPDPVSCTSPCFYDLSSFPPTSKPTPTPFLIPQALVPNPNLLSLLRIWGRPVWVSWGSGCLGWGHQDCTYQNLQTPSKATNNLSISGESLQTPHFIDRHEGLEIWDHDHWF